MSDNEKANSAENQTPTSDNQAKASDFSSKKKVPTAENAKPDLTKADWSSYSKDYGLNQLVDFESPFITYEDGTKPKLKVAMFTKYTEDPEVFELLQKKAIEADDERVKTQGLDRKPRSVEYRDRQRREDTEIMISHIVKGWENVKVHAPKTWVDADGKEHTETVWTDVPFSKAALRGFLESLTHEVFEDLLLFVSDTRYFQKALGSVPAEVAEATVGNSNDSSNSE